MDDERKRPVIENESHGGIHHSIEKSQRRASKSPLEEPFAAVVDLSSKFGCQQAILHCHVRRSSVRRAWIGLEGERRPDGARIDRRSQTRNERGTLLFMSAVSSDAFVTR